jgi:16S rRNA (cytidine1402-2'-O)-methyltransferase
MVGRELTKIHQQFIRGTSADVVSRLQVPPRGEFTVVIGPMTDNGAASRPPEESDIASSFWHKTNIGGVSRRAAISATAKELGISAKSVYLAIERSKIGDKTE